MRGIAVWPKRTEDIAIPVALIKILMAPWIMRHISHGYSASDESWIRIIVEEGAQSFIRGGIAPIGLEVILQANLQLGNNVFGARIFFPPYFPLIANGVEHTNNQNH